MLAGIDVVSDEDDVMLITNTGMIIRTRVSEISVYSRTAAGVRVMRIGDDMKIVSFTRVDKQEEQENAEGEENVLAEGEISESTDAPAAEAETTESTEVQE
jgi:DNA gyrase subunit A